MEHDNSKNRIAGPFSRYQSTVPVPPFQVPKEIEADPAVIAFAKGLQRHPKRQSCGGGSCGMKYEIPAYIIDAYANAKPKQ